MSGKNDREKKDNNEYIVTYNENKRKKLKRGLKNNKVMVVIIALALVGSVIYGVVQSSKADDYRNRLDNQYNRSFYELLGYVNNIDNYLLKAMVTSTPEKTSNLLEETWRYTTLAQTNIGQLPIKHETISNTSKFLVQLGDFSYMLINEQSKGNDITDKQYEQLASFQKYSEELNNTLGVMMDDINDGAMKWGELEKVGAGYMSEASNEVEPAPGIENLQKSFIEYPTLIYDGPFSDHMYETEPKSLTGKTIDEAGGEEIINKIFGKDKIRSIQFISRNEASKIKTLNYSVTLNEKDGGNDIIASVDLTQTGGYLYQMLLNREFGEKKVDVKEAKALGLKFLEKLDIESMVDSYYTNDDGSATINYVYSKDGVLYYPDMIKVKVALDTGEIVGFESKNYINNHMERKKLVPKITEAEAKEKVKASIKINSINLAVIPTEFNTEVFTYEIKCTTGKKDVIIYINAEDGTEEKVLIIIDSENGILTM